MRIALVLLSLCLLAACASPSGAPVPNVRRDVPVERVRVELMAVADRELEAFGGPTARWRSIRSASRPRTIAGSTSA